MQYSSQFHLQPGAGNSEEHEVRASEERKLGGEGELEGGLEGGREIKVDKGGQEGVEGGKDKMEERDGMTKRWEDREMGWEAAGGEGGIEFTKEKGNPFFAFCSNMFSAIFTILIPIWNCKDKLAGNT